MEQPDCPSCGEGARAWSSSIDDEGKRVLDVAWCNNRKCPTWGRQATRIEEKNVE